MKKTPKYLRWHKQACRNVCKQRQKYESERSEKNPVWVSAAVSAGPSAKCLLKHKTQVAVDNTHGNTQMRADCLCWCCRLNDRPHSSRSCPTHLYICSNTLQHREIWRHDGRVLLNAKELKNDRSYDCRSTETLWKFRFTIKWAKSVGLTAMAQWVTKSLSDSARFWRCGGFPPLLFWAQNQLYICRCQHSISGFDLTNYSSLFQTAAILKQLSMKQKCGFLHVIYVPQCENTFTKFG